MLSRGGEIGFHARGVKVAAARQGARERILEAPRAWSPCRPRGAGLSGMRRGDVRRFVS